MATQLAGVGVELEHAETEDMRRRGRFILPLGWWESSAYSPPTPVTPGAKGRLRSQLASHMQDSGESLGIGSPACVNGRA